MMQNNFDGHHSYFWVHEVHELNYIKNCEIEQILSSVFLTKILRPLQKSYSLLSIDLL